MYFQLDNTYVLLSNFNDVRVTVCEFACTLARAVSLRLANA